MGTIVDPTCRSCGHHWQGEVLDGTFMSVIVRCTDCGLPCVINEERFPGVLAKLESFNDFVLDDLVGACECGGTRSYRAPLRCPKCRSADVDQGPPLGFID